jgi:Protein of unknown function (DUF3617)
MRPALALLLALGAAACNGQAGGNRAGGSKQAAAPTAVTTPMQAGRWEMTTRAVSMDIPNAPPEIAAQLRAQPLPPAEIQYDCITPQEAANPMEGIRLQLVRDQPNLSCEPTEQQFSNGRIRIALECRGLNGQPDQRMAVVGSFTITTLQAAVSTSTTAPVAGSMQLVQVENTMIGRRVGECTGTETE